MQCTRYVTNLRAAHLGCVLLAFVLSAVTGPAQTGGTNYWTKPTSGDWEEPFWSLGVLPNASQAVVFNNPGWKALAIGAATARDFPQSVIVQSLQVASPVDTRNTLLMNWSGLERSLQTTFLSVGTNSSVAVHGSALEVLFSTNAGSGNLLLQGDFF